MSDFKKCDSCACKWSIHLQMYIASLVPCRVYVELVSLILSLSISKALCDLEEYSVAFTVLRERIFWKHAKGVQYQLATTSSDSRFLVDTAPSKLYSTERLRLWPKREFSMTLVLDMYVMIRKIELVRHGEACLALGCCGETTHPDSFW